MDPVDVILIGFAVALGAVVGSFLNVCVWRLPREGISVDRPRRSHCPSCGGAIAWFDNIPVWSWIRLGGRCRMCRAPVSPRYLAVECLTACLFGVIASRFLGGDEPRWGEFLVISGLGAALIVASFIDIDLRILPDEITLNGMMAAPLVALAVPGLHTRPPSELVWSVMSWAQGAVGVLHDAAPAALVDGAGRWIVGGLLGIVGAAGGLGGFHIYWRAAHPDVPNRVRDGALAGVLLGTLGPVLWAVISRPALCVHPSVVSYVAALAGMGVGSGLVLTVGILGGLLFRKEAMGFGDVKLMGLLGGFAGWGGVLAGFAIACILGSVVGVWRLLAYRTRYLWFGPFLSVGCFAVLLFPESLDRVLSWYLGLFR